MGQIGEFLEKALDDFSSTANLTDDYKRGLLDYGEMGVGTGVDGMDASFVWSLYQYKNRLSPEDNAPADETDLAILDELEKSIVAKIADDVIVGVKKDRANLTIIKNLDR